MIPLRFVIAMLGSYACALVYMHRAAISVAVVAMTKNQTQDIDDISSKNTSSSSPFSHSANDTSSVSSKPEFEWDETLQGIILGVQFYLYIFVPTLAGRATDAIGGKWIAFCGALGPCILAAITPPLTRLGGAWALIMNRILVGGFHGFTYAAMFSLFVKWFPKKELAIANGGLIFGGSLGSTIMSAISGYISEYFSWPWVFYILALFHVPFIISWFCLATNEPKNNPHLSISESKYIQENVQEKIISKKIKAPWTRMMLSIPVVCSLITKMCSGFGYFLLITKMPSYLLKVFNIDLFKNGWVYAGTNLANGIASLLAPPIANYLINQFGWRKVIVRKLFQSIALFGPALCLALIPSMELDSGIVIFLLIMAMMLYGFFSAGEWTIISEYAPNFAGTVFGYANILAFAMGVLAPYLVGVMLDANAESNREQWNKVFYIAVVIYLVGGLTFLFFATDQQQPWDREAAMVVLEHQQKDSSHKNNECKSTDNSYTNYDDKEMVVGRGQQ